MFIKLIQLIKIFDNKDKLNLSILFIMILIAMGLEIFSIFAVVPVIENFLSTENKFIFLKDIKYFQNYDLTNVLILIFLFIHLFKFIYLFVFNYFQNTFIQNLSAKLTARLFSNYLTQEYETHTQKEISKMVRNLLTEVRVLCTTLINPTFILIIESTILFGVIVFLIFYESNLSIILCLIFTALVFLYIILIKNKFLNWGISRQTLNNISLKISLDGLSGIKDLMIYNKENLFRNKLAENEFKFARVAKLYSTFQQLPRLIFEFIIIVFIILLVFFLKQQNLQNNEIIEIMGVYALAGLRLIPGSSKIIGSLQQIKFGIPALSAFLQENILHQEYYDNLLKKRSKKIIQKFKKSIELKDVSFSYKKNINNSIFQNLNLKINKNKIVGIYGQSGSGKSTLVDLLSGLLKPLSGQIILDGKVIHDYRRVRGLFAYVSQFPYILNDTILNNIILNKKESLFNTKMLKEALRLSQLDLIFKIHQLNLNTVVGERGSMLSGGQLQRIAIARAIYHQSEIIIFDESTNALDKDTENKMLNEIYKLKKIKTIVFITHNLSNLKICDQVYEIKNKKIIFKKKM